MKLNHAGRRGLAGRAGRCAPRLLLTLAVFGGAACERPAPDAAAGARTAAKPERSPRETLEQLIATRAARSYQAMDPFILPGGAHQVVNTLMAVDEFLQANRALCDYVRDEFASGLAQSIDQSHWGAHLDVFSHFVELIDEQIDADTATVSFRVDQQLPLRRARLVLIDGQWRYDPGDGYDARLPAAFQRMARGLRQVLNDLRDQRLDPATIRARPERLIEEVRVRLLPGIKMLPASPTTQPEDG